LLFSLTDTLVFFFAQLRCFSVYRRSGLGNKASTDSDKANIASKNPGQLTVKSQVKRRFDPVFKGASRRPGERSGDSVKRQG
jgi:hypothetical protein